LIENDAIQQIIHDFLLVCHCNYSYIVLCTIFELFDAQNIVTLKSRLGSLKVIGNGTIR